MLDITNEKLMNNYAQQFGLPGERGTRYVMAIIKRYVSNGCKADRNDYANFIRETAAEYGISSASMRSTIKSYIKRGWLCSDSFSWEWEKYTGWSEAVCPTAAVAVRLMCESYVPFVTKYKEVILRQRSYYLQAAIQEMETDISM